METASCGWAAESVAVLRKDLLSELRSRQALNAMVIFAVTTLAVVSFALGPHALTARAQSALLWVILFFAAAASLSRPFLREEEGRTSTALRLSAVPAHVFAGKLAFNILLLLGLDALLVPLYLGVMQAPVGSPEVLLMVVLLGSLGLAAACTIVAAIISRATTPGALFGGLAFPLLLPLLLAAVGGTTKAFEGAAVAAAWPELRLLLSFTVVVVTASWMLFEVIWDD
ncbi:MAG TPA: heme exporter protein CcmB [Chloroflexota bacterium]|nr:heme exporter protein CcmB [Chloroflexota bacterium]